MIAKLHENEFRPKAVCFNYKLNYFYLT